MKNALWIQHVSFEGLGYIEEWLLRHEYALTSIAQYEEAFLAGESSFDQVLGHIDIIVVMGGPMGIFDYEEYPWLKNEKALIKKAIQLEIPILGICLGAQILADVLGAKVYKGPYKEIGWYCVDFNQDFFEEIAYESKESAITVFHWHGDTFELPEGCKSIGNSQPGILQGFYKSNIVGLQFHLEMTPDTVNDIVFNGEEELKDMSIPRDYIQPKTIILETDDYFVDNRKFLDRIMKYLVRK